MDPMLESLGGRLLLSRPGMHGRKDAEQDAGHGRVHSARVDADPRDQSERPEEPAAVEALSEREPVEPARDKTTGQPQEREVGGKDERDQGDRDEIVNDRDREK